MSQPIPINTVINAERGLVVAPAGCGKTELICESVLHSNFSKPILILTHTTAGVSALKQRLARKGVSPKIFRVETIDGWALKLARLFPLLSAYEQRANARPDYPDLRVKVCQLLSRGDLSGLIEATYGKVFVDEYQDCSTSQHNTIGWVAESVSVVVFGDPLQSIFNFDQNDPLPNWVEVERVFPGILRLDRPWRWINAGEDELGEWLLNMRETLLQGRQIDLQDSPANIIWHPLTGNFRNDSVSLRREQFRIRQLCGEDDRFLVIGDSRNRENRHEFARSSNGLNVVEPVELGDVVTAALTIDRAFEGDLLRAVLTFAGRVMTGISVQGVVDRVGSIQAGRNRKPATDLENIAIEVIEERSREVVASLLVALSCDRECRVFRRSALNAMCAALIATDKPLSDSIISVREQRRHIGDKRVSKRSIGSTLLLKGLEAEYVLILNADERNMDAKNLYVALTRGARCTSIFSTNSLVG